MMGRNSFGIIVGAFFIAATLFAGGCASKSGSQQKVNQADWEWVPSVWVVDSFGNKYDRCTYDQYYDGYLCPPGTR
jgi:hypothetical protein